MLCPPNDLIELPVLYWDERPYGMELKTHECIAALWKANGNVDKAAQLLRIDPARMRRIVHRFPEVKANWLEIREQMLDQAEANVRAALNSREPRRRDGMARFVLQRAGREYGTQKHAERLSELGTVRLV